MTTGILAEKRSINCTMFENWDESFKIGVFRGEFGVVSKVIKLRILGDIVIIIIGFYLHTLLDCVYKYEFVEAMFVCRIKLF